MSDLESEFSDSLHTAEEKASHFTQAGSIHDTSLNQLRDQIKKVMIPLLIKIFQLKLELSQTLSLPSRLQSIKSQNSPDAITEQLKLLDKDLKVLFLWCQSCRNQIQKALCTPEEERKSPVATTSPGSAHPGVSKSFSEAVSAQSSLFLSSTFQESDAEPSLTPPPVNRKKWWHSLLKKQQ